MNSEQISGATTTHLNHPFGNDHTENYQDQNTMSWPRTSFPPTAFNYNVGNPEPSPLESPPQQSSGPSEDRLSSSNLQCEYCPQVFQRQFELTKHERTHTKPLSCHLCSNGYIGAAEQKDLNRHFWVHHKSYARSSNKPKDSGTCNDCGQEFRSDNLKRHQQRAKHGEYQGRT